MNQSKLDQFQIIKKIGEGSYSEVYLVKRNQDQILYAAKKILINSLSQKEQQNALNEIRLLASLKHNNIVSYKQAFFDDPTNSLYIILEYSNLGDLASQIKEHQKNKTRFSEEEIWKCLIDILKGLSYLHQKDICHRDIKSGNVFIKSENNSHIYQLGDFNVSKIQKKQFNYTQIGTPYYAAPEIWRNFPYDTKTDIWSLGCLIYEMACLVPPFQANNKDQLSRKIIRGDFQPIPECYSYDLQKIINCCLRINPKIRFSTEELFENLIIKNKISLVDKFFKDQTNMLNTIDLPSNLKLLDLKLPESNYETVKTDRNLQIQRRLNENSQYSNNETPRIIESKLQKTKSVYDFSQLMIQKERSLIEHISPEIKMKQITKTPSIFSISNQYKNQIQNIQSKQNIINALLLR